ncbi:MAG: hypothetical protein K6E26_08235 [Clostridiales bacterium]|nr:hypothetical protein [Clostridiales bacterium]
MSRYDDIIHMNRPQYPDLPPMSIHDRAAQFSPFAALVGYEDAVAETERITDRRREMSEEETRELNEVLSRLAAGFSENPKNHPHVHVLYFIPDEKKSGGRYAEKEGQLRTIDSYHRTLVFTDGESISVEFTYQVRMIEG